jgi:K+-transporting ATPase ATPase C chain
MWFRAASVFLSLTLMTGVVYPLLATLLAQVAFPHQAGGSLLHRDGKVIGSRLIGQSFEAQAYFWGRPSATSPFPYNAALGAGSNLAPSNPKLLEQVANAVAHVSAAHEGRRPVPIDLVTCSASGLDPHISIAAAEYQIARVAAARRLDPSRVQALVKQHSEQRFLGLLGEARVNVLLLNLALDEIVP